MTVAYLPAEQRVDIIRAYGQKYRISTFVETGTNVGSTVDALLHDFDPIITIELDPDLFSLACIRFAAEHHVLCLQGDSADVLPDLVRSLTAPAIFWLDGHFCGGARGPIDTPIRDELLAAVTAPIGSVILIDDARLFGGMPEHTEEFKDYPDVDWIARIAQEFGFLFDLQFDIMRLTPLGP